MAHTHAVQTIRHSGGEDDDSSLLSVADDDDDDDGLFRPVIRVTVFSAFLSLIFLPPFLWFWVVGGDWTCFRLPLNHGCWCFSCPSPSRLSSHSLSLCWTSTAFPVSLSLHPRPLIYEPNSPAADFHSLSFSPSHRLLVPGHRTRKTTASPFFLCSTAVFASCSITHSYNFFRSLFFRSVFR